MAGAAVVFGDVDRRTFTLDPDSVARKITPRTRAIVPVHLYGHCAEMDPLLGLARKHGLRVIEDCAHAPGAEYKGRRAGSMGDLGCFSFGTQKNMTTLGEGGMVVTNDAELERRVRSRRWICAQGYGAQGRFGEIDAGRIPMGRQYWRLEFDEIGGNLRMTDIQAAAGLVQLRKLDALTERRRAIAARYGQGLGGIRGLVTPSVSAHVRHVYHVYAVLIEPDFGMSKEDFMWELRERKGITPWSHYMPIHLTAAYRKMGHAEGECPVAESLFERYVSLPLHPRLTDQAVEYLIRSVRELALERAKPIQDCLV
jgi:dTDP-4-amino-4,6-dideoxygalactose transaminase